VHLLLRANGEAAWPGWPTSAPLEALRAQWLDAPDLASQQAIARQIQARAFEDLPYIPLGQFFQPTAYRRAFTGVLKGPTVFWNIRRV
jgi:peptide/nickel transport system substrate-binding protein